MATVPLPPIGGEDCVRRSNSFTHRNIHSSAKLAPMARRTVRKSRAFDKVTDNYKHSIPYIRAARSMYNVHCTLYSVHCTVYIVQCTLYSVHCTLYSVHCTVYIVQCTLYSVHCIVYIDY